jgi:hypothetical protein
MTDVDAQRLDDYVLEIALANAVRAGDRVKIDVLRAEARRRFAGMHGLPTTLMEDA